MEARYWTPTLEEAKEFETYTYEEHRMATDVVTKFYKKQLPYLIPSESPDMIKEQQRWLDVSAREDFYVLEREKEAFDVFYTKAIDEVLPYVK